MKVSASDTAIDALHKLLPSMGLGHVTWAQSCHFSFFGRMMFSHFFKLLVCCKPKRCGVDRFY